MDEAGVWHKFWLLVSDFFGFEFQVSSHEILDFWNTNSLGHGLEQFTIHHIWIHMQYYKI